MTLRFLPPAAPAVLEPDARFASFALLAFVALLPFEPLYNAPLIALGVLGVLCVVSGRVRLGSPENRFLCLAFLCMWLPMLASLPDAVNPVESIRKTASLCIYFFAGVYATGAYTRFRDLDRVMAGVTIICIVWCLDALYPLLPGADRFGAGHEEGGRLTGLFSHPGRIGNVLVGFAPLFFEGIRRASGRWRWSPVLLAPYLAVILLSGARTAWGALAVAAVGYLWLPTRRTGRGRWKSKRAAAACAAVVLAVTAAASARPEGMVRAWEVIEPRIESLAGLWSGDRVRIETATSFRISLWETAARMFSEHWLNGVGPRGFRRAYYDYSPVPDYFLMLARFRRPPADPHLPILEIAVSTGVLGLLGYALLAAGLLSRLRRLDPDSFRFAYPYALALIVALFPLNGHLSFHGVLATGSRWWTIILTASAFAVAARMKRDRSPPVRGAGRGAAARAAAARVEPESAPSD